MRRNVLAAAALSSLLVSCAHQAVNRDALASVKRVGVVSVVIDRLAAGPNDEPILRAAADRAVQLVDGTLARRSEWTVVPASQLKQHPRCVALAQVRPQSAAETKASDLRAVGTALLSMLKTGGAAAQPEGEMLPQVPARSGSRYVPASGMPVLPWTAFESAKHGDRSFGSSQQKGPPPEYPDDARETLRKEAGKLAQELGLDAVAFVYLKTAIRSTVGINTIVNGRGIDTVRMAPTMVVIAKDGSVVLDLGDHVIDAITQGRAGVPIYAVVYDRNGAHKDRDGRRFSLVTDLADPKGKVREEMIALVDEAIPDLAKGFDKLLAAK
jgi:hypothetical protein